MQNRSLKTLFCCVVAGLSSSTSLASTRNTLHITMNPAEFEVQLWQENKYDFEPVAVQINNGPQLTADLNIRGQNCLKAARKCFGLKFDEKQEFPGLGELESKSSNLVSMWHEYGYISSKVGFEFFRATGLFDVRTEYTEVVINGESFGLYLVVEKPKRAIKRANDDTTDDIIVARRKFSGRLDLNEDHDDHSRRGDFREAYLHLAQSLETQSGQRLLNTLHANMDLDSYLYWLLGNSVLKNGDYTDELYIYADMTQPSVYFQFMPWDLDDLFKGPHWANTDEQKEAIATSLLYSLEISIDQKIQDDEVLYNYLKSLGHDFLRDLRANNYSLVDEVFDKTQSSILPYLDDQNVLNGGLIDGKDNAYTRSQILRLLERRRQEVKDRIDLLLERTL